LQYNKKIYNVSRGDILVIGKNEFHYCNQHNEESVTLISLKFLEEIIHSFIGYDIDFEYIRPFYSKSSKFQNMIPKGEIENEKILEQIMIIKELVENQKKHYQIKAKNALLEILLKIVEFYDEIPTDLYDQHSKHMQDLDRLKDVFELINNSYSEKLTLKRVAQVACLNETYFSSFFKKVTGFTFSNYLQRARVEKAKEMLVQTDFSTTRIAFLSGFNSYNYFDKTFKKLTKFTPSKYRERILKNKI
jgi:YesN/AraC family two-component response regulator